MEQQTQMKLPPLVNVGRFTFSPLAILGIDWSQSEQKIIKLLLVGPHSHTFMGSDADEFKLFWDQSTGQAKIQPASIADLPINKRR